MTGRGAGHCAGYDAPARYERVQDVPHLTLLSVVLCPEDRLCRRHLLLVRPHRPSLVVQIALGKDRNEIHIGFPIRIQRADIPPVSTLRIGSVAEAVDKDPILLNHTWHYIFAEIMVRRGILGVLNDSLHQCFSIEDVDPH